MSQVALSYAQDVSSFEKELITPEQQQRKSEINEFKTKQQHV